MNSDNERSPRPGDEPKDEVRLRGEPSLVKKLKAELEKVTADLRDRVVYGVQVPAAAHSALIGRGGRNLINFQNKHNVQVQYPGSNSYKFTGDAENVEELGDVAPEELVKVMGPKAAVEQAIEQLKVRTSPRNQEGTCSQCSTVAGQQCHSSRDYHRHHFCSTQVPRCRDTTGFNFPHSSHLWRRSRAFCAAYQICYAFSSVELCDTGGTRRRRRREHKRGAVGGRR